MNNLEKYYNGYKTSLEMIKDRGFDVPHIYNKVNKKTLEYLVQNDNLYIYCTTPDKQKKILIYFFKESKVKPNYIRGLIKKIFNSDFGKENTVIFVSRDKINTTLNKIEKESNNPVKFMFLNSLQKNITKHKLVPRHSLATDDEIRDLKKRYKLKSLTQLPIILKNDPIVLYYGFPSGKVCKIVRKSDTAIVYTNFRYIK